MTMANKIGVDTRSLEDREHALLIKLRRTANGDKVVELLSHAAPMAHLQRLVVAAHCGEELWREYWELHCAKVEAEMEEFFQRLADNKSKTSRTNII